MLHLHVDQQSATPASMGGFLPEAFQELPLGILIMGAQGEIRLVNQAALNLLGLTESQLLGKTPLDPDWHVIQEDGTPFQLKLQSAPVRARQALLLLSTRQPLRNLVLGIYRPTAGKKISDQDESNARSQADRVWLSVSTEPQLAPDGSVEQVICTLSDITNRKTGDQLAKIHSSFLSLGSDPDENITLLTALAGELLGGAWAVYHRLHQGLLLALGQWQTPPKFSNIAEPSNHICHQVIQNGSKQILVLQDLQKSDYAAINPYIIPYKLQTYLGQAVKCAGRYIGALSVVYQNNFVPCEVDKQLLGIIAAAIGVEEERKRESLIWAKNEAKWRSLIHNSSNLITIVEPDGYIRYVSPAIQEILGYKPKELIGKNTFDFIHPEDLRAVKNNFKNVVKNPTISLSIEFRFQHKDGSWRYIESTHSNLLMDAPVARIVINSRDVTDRKLADEALRNSETQLREKAEQLENALHELQETQTQLIQTEKMSSLGLLVAGIAHEINNPVSFIYGNIPHATEYTEHLLDLVNLYRQHYPQPVAAIQAASEEIDLEFLSEDLPKLMDSMQIGAERIRQIVLSLRNFSRLDKTAREPIDLHQGIDNTLLLLQHRLKAKSEHPQIQIIKEYDNLPLVECHAGQLNQVFMNLLSNAIDALEEVSSINQVTETTNPNCKLLEADFCPSIRIKTQLQNNHTVLIQIADNGSGIPLQMQQQIFDPFFTTKSVGKGTGLGLSISYQIIVEKHGGQLKCFSTPGEGTEFWIELPLLPPEQELN
jgi:PAS domain S-box-containing protein